MGKIITTIILGIFLFSFASAITIYSGETIYYDFTNEVDIIQEITWEVVNNNYNLEGLNITTNFTGATVSTDPLFKPDNFTIIFTIMGKNEEPIIIYRGGGGGGGGGTKIIYKDVNNTIIEYVDKIIKEEPEEPEPPIEEGTTKGVLKKILYIILVVYILFGMVLFYHIYKFYKFTKKRIKK